MTSTDTPTFETTNGTAHHILVGVDGSESSHKALAWAVRQAKLTGAIVLALTTWEWPDNFGWTVPIADDYDPAADAKKILEDGLAPVRAAHPEVTIETTVVESHPAPALVEASKHAELLVVGSRGHGQFSGMLIGSTSSFCVTHAHCPVLVMRNE